MRQNSKFLQDTDMIQKPKKIFLIKNRQLTRTEIILTSNSSLVPRLLRQVLGYTSAIASLMYCLALS